MTSYLRYHFHQLAVMSHQRGKEFRKAGLYDKAFACFAERRIQIERSKGKCSY